MPDIVDNEIEQLLLDAEQRLQNGTALTKTESTPGRGLVSNNHDNGGPGSNPPAGDASKAQVAAVRSVCRMDHRPKREKTTAGSDWFDLPRTVATPEFKRDWQVLRMRNVLDPKHQKKALHSSLPEFSQAGEVIAGPTDSYGGKLARKDKRLNILEETMRDYDRTKLQSKYAGIHRSKTSGKRAFYQKLMVQRRKRH